MSIHRRTSGRALLSSLVGVALVLAACGGDEDADEPAETELSALAAEGRDLARSYGCQGCHSASSDRGIGPTWRGLAGSEVELSDGRTVVADRDYLRRSILDPGADERSGFMSMPRFDLEDEEVDAIVAYIESLATP